MKPLNIPEEKFQEILGKIKEENNNLAENEIQVLRKHCSLPHDYAMVASLTGEQCLRIVCKFSKHFPAPPNLEQSRIYAA